MKHEMPQSLLVFPVTLTSETPNFGTFGGVAHPPLEEFLTFFKILFFKCVYAHI